VTTRNGPPTLWHLKVSHYNEKARWALDFKRVPHFRRALTPGRHREVAEKLTGGQTFPILVLDGEGIGDSTRIIEALEHRFPGRSLYPADADERRRSLELEDFFDEELGPHTRLLAVHHVLPDARLMLGTFASDVKGARRLIALATFSRLRPKIVERFGMDEDRVTLAFDKVRAAGERFRRELGRSGYLVGNTFTVADLTAAALVAPIVCPEQFPYPQPQRGHPRLAPVREALAESGIDAWAREVYERWRGTSAEVAG
jgi:glutathione S-transferase